MGPFSWVSFNTNFFEGNSSPHLQYPHEVAEQRTTKKNIQQRLRQKASDMKYSQRSNKVKSVQTSEALAGQSQ